MSLWDEIRKGTAQSIDPLGIGFSGGAQLIAGKDNYDPLIDLGDTGTQIARMVALAVASYFTFGGASAAAPASGAGATSTGAGTVATNAGSATAGATTAGATAAGAPIVDVAAAPSVATAGAAPITDVSISAAPTVAPTSVTTSGGGLFTANNAMRAAGYLAMAGSSGGGYSAPNVATPTPFQRAPRPNAVPYNPQPSNSNRPTDTMGGTLATSPQGVTGKATTTSRLGTRRLLG